MAQSPLVLHPLARYPRTCRYQCEAEAQDRRFFLLTTGQTYTSGSVLAATIGSDSEWLGKSNAIATCDAICVVRTNWFEKLTNETKPLK